MTAATFKQQVSVNRQIRLHPVQVVAHSTAHMSMLRQYGEDALGKCTFYQCHQRIQIRQKRRSNSQFSAKHLLPGSGACTSVLKPQRAIVPPLDVTSNIGRSSDSSCDYCMTAEFGASVRSTADQGDTTANLHQCMQ
eukprot:scaffold112208_cov25-Prasinocladus_malaysianus.AAC.1